MSNLSIPVCGFLVLASCRHRNGNKRKVEEDSVLMQSCATGDSLRQLGLERQFECKRKPLRKKKKKKQHVVFPCVYVCVHMLV